MWLLWCAVIVAFVGPTAAENTVQPATVRTSGGSIIGTTRVSRNGRQFYAFLGIPFAEPPVGDLRFRNPVPKKPWRGVLRATKDPPMCAQLKVGVFKGQEDCLYVNVYTPRVENLSGGGRLPVIVYIPGGIFYGGDGHASHWDPAFLLDKDIVLVTVQYRVGLAGFLATADPVSPGNYGIKDQILALHWVRQNICTFAGNPYQVTLMGHSSGAVSVAAQAVSDMSKGLFQKYIMMSGNLQMMPAFHKGANGSYVELIRNLASDCGCTTVNSTAMVECLREKPIEELVKVNTVWNQGRGQVAMPSIVAEPQSSDKPFWTEDPTRIIAERGAVDLPFMIGHVKDEALYQTAEMYSDDGSYEYFRDNFNAIILNILQYYVGPERASTVLDTIKNHYITDFFPSDRHALTHQLTEILSDLLMFYPVYKFTESQLRHGTQPFYVYNFRYRGTMSVSAKILGNNRNIGVCHADELTYVFKRDPASLMLPNETMSETDYKMVDLMVDWITSFAITGKATSQHMENPYLWKAYGSKRNYLQIGDNSTVVYSLHQDFRGSKLRFLEKLLG